MESVYPRVVFPDWLDARREAEAADKGYLGGVVVEGQDGARFPIFVMDPTRLRQDLESAMTKLGEPWLAEPGLIVVHEVTIPLIERAVRALWGEGFFEHLKALNGGRE